MKHSFAALLLVAAALASAACGQPVPPGDAAPAGPALDDERIPNPLAVYRQLGFVVGDRSFPAVGRFVFLPGPGDSTYAIFTFSVPNTALRFRREDPGYLARYRVSIVVGDTADPVARLDESQEVRVRSFRETSRRDESVLFQGFLILEPGYYLVAIDVRDLASRDGFAAGIDLRVPRYRPAAITAPILVYDARARADREAAPALIVNPRATVQLGGPGPLVYVEAFATPPAPAGPGPIVEVHEEGRIILADTLRERGGPGAIYAAVDSLDEKRLPAGALTLRARLPEPPAADSATLLVALAPGWLAPDYDGVLSYLRYAGTATQLDSLRAAPPGERARLLHAFWKKRDPNPETPENEFFERYFSRIQDANDRFAGAMGPGWLTDRGEVYVTLGPPDEVTRHLDTRQGSGQAQVWLYNESLGFELRLVFTDVTGTGQLILSPESRRAFHEAVRRLYS